MSPCQLRLGFFIAFLTGVAVSLIVLILPKYKEKPLYNTEADYCNLQNTSDRAKYHFLSGLIIAALTGDGVIVLVTAD